MKLFIKSAKLLLAASVATLVLSFSNTDEQPKMRVELTLSEWNAVFEVIEESNAPHKKVVAIKEMLSKQLIPQLPKDSTSKK